MLDLSAEIETFPLLRPFTISRGTKTETIVVTATVSSGDIVGRGECGPNARYEETPESVLDDILTVAPNVKVGLDRVGLRDILPPGAARNAIDCALWDFEAKAAGRPVWSLMGADAPAPVETAFTLSAAGPDDMSREAAANADRPLLKLKLTGSGDLDRVRAVRKQAGDARLIVDANESWDAEIYCEIVPALADLGVELIEQPFPATEDGVLSDLDRPVAVCADESFHDSSSLAGLQDKYDVVNIKLDKTGGLTEAMSASRAARSAGFRVMVGCMVGTSLAMAPAMLVAQQAEFVDLDGPLLLATDREPGLEVHRSTIMPPRSELWG